MGMVPSLPQFRWDHRCRELCQGFSAPVMPCCARNAREWPLHLLFSERALQAPPVIFRQDALGALEQNLHEMRVEGPVADDADEVAWARFVERPWSCLSGTDQAAAAQPPAPNPCTP